MRSLRFISFLAAALLCLSAPAQDYSALDGKLDEYLSALEGESIETKQTECDYIISACKDSVVRNYVAVKLYNHFFTSPLMGDEAVAIYLTDNWFSTSKAEMPSKTDYFNAKIFADFNRSSLLGLQAPGLILKDPAGNAIDVPLSGGGEKVLFFHDTSCADCKVENLRLQAFFARGGYDLDFISVYTGDDASAWAEYCKAWESRNYPRVRVFNYWDPEGESDFQMRYGVLSTPRMFLIDGEGVIVGRSLETESLEKLLSARRELYKEVTADILFKLWEQPDGASRESAAYVADSLILARPDIWNTRADTLKVVGMALLVHDLTSRAVVGSVLPHIKVPGEMVRRCSTRKGEWALDKLGRTTCIVFYSDSCSSCREALAAVRPGRREAYLLVNIDDISRNDPDLAVQLLDTFDLSVLPHIILSDKKGQVQARYLSLTK